MMRVRHYNRTTGGRRRGMNEQKAGKNLRLKSLERRKMVKIENEGQKNEKQKERGERRRREKRWCK